MLSIENSIVSSKKMLRNKMKKILGELTQNELNVQSNKIFKSVTSLIEYQKAKNISIYLNMPKSEVKTEELLKHALKSGKNCFIPFIVNSYQMEMVKLNSWEDFLSLPKSKWGYPEPRNIGEWENAFESNGLDLIIVPGMAFDKYGNRLGHGKGYYDRYIKKASTFAEKNNKNKPFCVSISLTEQVINETIPTDEFDIKPDLILTPEGPLELLNRDIPEMINSDEMINTSESDLEEWEIEEHTPISNPKIGIKKGYILQTESYGNNYTPQVKILKRDKNEKKNSLQMQNENIKKMPIKTLAEREEEYRQAKLKIFGSLE